MISDYPLHDTPSPTIHGTHRSQTVFRIVDFFSAAQAINEGYLYVPLSSKFEDQNEALDAAIHTLALSVGPCAGITGHFKTVEEFISYQRSIAQLNYVSCWTRTKESVAMWALYSKDYSSVQLSTTVGSLEKATLSLAETHSDPRDILSTGSKRGQFFSSSTIAAVKYTSLDTVAQGLSRRRRAYDKLTAAGKVSLAKEFKGASNAELRRLDQYSFEPLEHKDISFAHESEIRLILCFTPYDEVTLANTRDAFAKMPSTPNTDIADVKYQSNMRTAARVILRSEAYKRGLSCESSIRLPLPPGFITDLTIDPRCPPHKLRFMRSYFSGLGVKISESKCFGNLAHNFDLTPRSTILSGK